MHYPPTRFLERSIPLGLDEFLSIEMAVVPDNGISWVILRESRTAKGHTPVLTASFEQIANYVRSELVWIRRLPDTLKFVHCRYEQRPTGTFQWNYQEVNMQLKDEIFGYATWRQVSPETADFINEALNLSQLPLKMHP